MEQMRINRIGLTRDAPGDTSNAVRFALAYLYAVSSGDRSAFDLFWTQARITPKDAADAEGRSQMLNAAINGIYRAVNVQRTPEMQFYMVTDQRNAG